MALRIRLQPKGKKRALFYQIVAVDSRAPRDGGRPRLLGTYDPKTSPGVVHLETEKVLACLKDGATPSRTVKDIFSALGISIKRHLQLGVNKGVITQTMADKLFAEWETKKLAKTKKTYVPKAVAA